MSFEADKELIDEYNEWSAQKRSFGTDVSAEAFLTDRAKEQALSTLIKINELAEANPKDWDDWSSDQAIEFAYEVWYLVNDL